MLFEGILHWIPYLSMTLRNQRTKDEKSRQIKGREVAEEAGEAVEEAGLVVEEEEEADVDFSRI